MDYFVTVNGVTVAQNVTKDKAISIGKTKVEKGNVGIGKNKRFNGKRVYTLLPLHLYI